VTYINVDQIPILQKGLLGTYEDDQVNTGTVWAMTPSFAGLNVLHYVFEG